VNKVVTAIAFVISVIAVVTSSAQAPEQPLFKSGVDRVALAAVVRDGKGKLVMDLTTRDFELLDSGRRTPLIGVWAEPSPASVALLLDVSGSMATKLERAREASRYLLGGLQPGVDEAALYSFDTELKELRPFSTDIDLDDRAWASTRAYGATSLWDAIAETSSRISSRQKRRALVVMTDGVDSASRLTSAQVSGIASLLNVPVYVVVIAFSSDDDGRDRPVMQGPLGDLAAWTGGELLVIHDGPGAITAMRQIVTELQHQYVVAFEPGTAPGWHELVLRTKKSGLFVRARNGYMVGATESKARPASEAR
jgi:Ca-activated chloride channel family protein